MIDVNFDNVSKRYRIPRAEEGSTSRSPLRRKIESLWHRPQEFYALREVTFEVRRGEALGIIGRNGAGKSTVLKLLSNITLPTSGEITISGRLSALIEVGSGFHPELTGRENVFLNGSILGMRRSEIGRKLNDIIEFAGVRQFIDTPVKHYSSGMYVRLGFSIAAHLEPNILLLDEVLTVGDASFQDKCIKRILELKRSGTTIVFISHDLSAVERLCDRTLLLDGGRLVANGLSHEVVARYRHSLTEFVPSSEKPDKGTEIISLGLRDYSGHETSTFYTGCPIRIRVEFVAHHRIEDVAFELFLHTASWDRYCQLTTELSDTPIDLQPGAGAIDFSCDELGLQPGMYYISPTIIHRGQSMGEAIDWRPECVAFHVDPGKVVRGSFYMPSHWQVVKNGGIAQGEFARASLSKPVATIQPPTCSD
jgi:ABC-type polysaccharide/polyol phosphate transport system ATPase subunit